MKSEVITATLAAVIAVASAIISIYGQSQVARLANRLNKQREAELKKSANSRSDVKV